jgi:thiamine pyrophosphokinase
MKSVTIFANGDVSSSEISLPPDEIVIAADGGAFHCLRYGIPINFVIGDFDSLSTKEISKLLEADIDFIRHSTDKDETDLELALNHALKLGATDITLYGVLGGRWDMSIANILLLATPSFTKIRFKIMDENTTGYLLRGGNTLNLKGRKGTIVSAIPLDNRTKGITYQGLIWSLNNEYLKFGTSRGLSNVMISTEAKITLEEGILLVFLMDSVN